MANFWLMKSEPSCFSIDDLKNAPKQRTYWDGVRNYQARNFILSMKTGDGILFYHSNCKPPAIAGTATVISDPYPDHTALDPESEHPDPKSTAENPRWFMVDIQFETKLSHPIALDELKNYPELAEMLVLRRGNRLSVTPVTSSQWQFITQELGNKSNQ